MSPVRESSAVLSFFGLQEQPFLKTSKILTHGCVQGDPDMKVSLVQELLCNQQVESWETIKEIIWISSIR